MSPIDFRLVLEGLADAVIVADATGSVVYANGAAGTLFGWPADELIGRPLPTLMPARMRAAHEAGFRRYATTHEPHILGRGRPIRLPALRRDGSEIEVDLTLSS